MRAERAALVADRSLRGEAFCRAFTAVADRWFVDLLDTAGDGQVPPGVALVAVGGYGRGDLCPRSDLDIMLVHSGRQPRLEAVAESIWYPLWDAGLKVGHSTRTVDQALALADDDLDTATALLDARGVAGDGPLAHELAATARSRWRAAADRWLPRLAEAVEARHHKMGEVAFLLEPDLKEARGGLRDIHALRWAEAARRTLVGGDDESIEAARLLLVDVRVELHRHTGKASDVLLLQDQDAVAESLGCADADALMEAVATAARAVAWRSDEAWAAVRAVGRHLRWRALLGRDETPPEPPGAGLQWSADGVLELAGDADVAGDPGLPLRAAAAVALASAPGGEGGDTDEAGRAGNAVHRIGRSALDRLAAEAPEPPGPWAPDMRHDLVRLLSAGPPAIAALEALDQAGLLVRLLPEWQAVRSRPQRNAYHRFTVDRHLCEAAVQAAALAGRVHRPDLLLVGALLHDIGKGYVPELSHDHSEAGVEIVGRVAARVGFPPADVEVLITLVRHHLLLADTATRRDIHDPVTLATVAAAVGQRETLHLLHALTEADSIATGPAAWSAWKADLVTELVNQVELVLAGDEATPGPGAGDSAGDRHAAARARAAQTGGVAVVGQDRWVTILAPDRPGLFSRVAGTLTFHGLDVLTARAWLDGDGMAVEEIRVEPVFGGDPSWEHFERDLALVLRGRLSLEARVAERALRYAGRIRSTAAAEARTSVTADADASATATVVEVRAPDRIGTLYRITRALADLHLDIRHAMVSTLGHEVVDTFYVVDAEGAKLDADYAAEVERAVLTELSRV